MMKYSRMTALCAVVLIALITILGKGGDGAPAEGDNGGNGGNGDNGDNGGGETADVAGIWDVTQTNDISGCPLDPDETSPEVEMYSGTLTQDGTSVSFTGPKGNMVSGTLDGNMLPFTSTYTLDADTDDEIMVTETGTVTFDGDNFTGSGSFTATFEGGSCMGGIMYAGMRASGGGDMSGTAEGLWFGAVDPMGNIKELAGVILDDGGYWFVFSQEDNSDVIGGILQGTGTSDNGSFTSLDGKVFDVDAGISDVTMSAMYVEKLTLSGTVGDSMEQDPFSAVYNMAYDMTPSLDIIAGSYIGSAASVSGRVMANMDISPTGPLTGSIVGELICTFLGEASVHASGNVYDLSITFDGGPGCDLGSQTVTGIAVFEEDELIAATINLERNDGFVFLGAKIVPF
jgi:hypothetical protein